VTDAFASGESARRAVLLDVDVPVSTITLCRPAAANAIDAHLLRDLDDAKRAVAVAAGVRVVVVTGAGQHFCAGADLREDRAARRASRVRFGSALDLGTVPQPVIAAINGPALGGGCELALTCDFRIMAADATIGLPEIRFGALPRGGGTARLPRLIGLPQAKRMIMTGEHLTAARALQIGLVDEVCEPGALTARVREFAGRLASAPDYALRAAKQLLDSAMSSDLPAALAREREVTRTMATREQRQEARQRAAAREPTYARIFGAAGAEHGVTPEEDHGTAS
jgi:enoyl-CoA hydratase/carnithine racemase